MSDKKRVDIALPGLKQPIKTGAAPIVMINGQIRDESQRAAVDLAFVVDTTGSMKEVA